jgi:hypothetical protein
MTNADIAHALTLTERDGSVRLELRVKPRASRSKILGTRGGALLIAVAAPPVDGEANEAVRELLARELRIPKRAVEILVGTSGRNKIVAVDGLGIDDIRGRLTAKAHA